MNNKTLVAYFTKGGASEEYANIISETLTANGLSVEQVNLADTIPDISDFDVIVLGTGVRISMVYRRWKKVLKQKSIKKKHLFMFLSSGTAIEKPDKAVDKFLKPIVEKYELNPDLLVSFPGKTPEKWAKYDDAPKGKMNPDLAKTWAEEIIRHLQEK
jgi:menaquinone-dependent protoporphyrinogen IX oxidase